MKKVIKSWLKVILPAPFRRFLRKSSHFLTNYKNRNYEKLPSFLHYGLAKKSLPAGLLNKKHFNYRAAISLQAYRRSFGRYPDFSNPKLFTEKVMKRIHTTCQTSTLYPLLADKYRVREYVAKHLASEEYLIPLVADFATINALISELKANPQKYLNTVIKVNHGCGQNYFIGTDPLSDQELAELEALLQQWFHHPHTLWYEMHYARIKPHLVVERRLGDGTALVDYKFHLFKQPDGSFDYMFQYINDRFSDLGISHCYFINQLIEAYLPSSIKDHRFTLTKLSPTELMVLPKILELSKKLMVDLDYARIDWFYVDGKIYFGEITLTPAAGAYLTNLDDKLDQQLGTMWHYNP